MLTPAIKHALKVIFVFIVITGLIASYLFMGSPTQSQQATQEAEEASFQFVDPGSAPATGNPAEAPSAAGPATPPPASQ